MAAVQRAHRLAIPFENLDIPLARGISLDPSALFDKLVHRRRGGYCFEQNSLFLAALHALGFEARPLLARVWLGASKTPPKTHTFNLVTIDREEWIADAGFGGSYTPPLLLEDGAEAKTPDGAGHRLRRDDIHGWMLERAGGTMHTDGRASDAPGWLPQYSFTCARVFAADLSLANHFTATAPGTRFTTFRVASIATPFGFASLLDRKLTINGDVDELGTAEAYREALQRNFGLTLASEDIARLALFS